MPQDTFILFCVGAALMSFFLLRGADDGTKMAALWRRRSGAAVEALRRQVPAPETAVRKSGAAYPPGAAEAKGAQMSS